MSHEKLRPRFTTDSDKLSELKKLVPESFADGKINWDTLKEALGEFSEEEGLDAEHFGLFWPGKREARKIAAMPSKGTLVPVSGDGIEEDATHNIFIEGENLEVLKLLQKSYEGSIKMIYIDPPYNTKNDFVYEDDYSEPLDEYLKRIGAVDEDGKMTTTNNQASGRYHSKWLSMMYPRLRLSRNLLKDDGVIVIHIDEHEYSSLILLLNEIFGEENNLGTIIWDKRNPKGDATGVAYQHESIIVYAKDKVDFIDKNPFVRAKKNAKAILKKAQELFAKLNKEEIPSDLRNCVENYKLPKNLSDKYKTKINLDRINEEFAEWLNNQSFSGGELAYNKIDKAGDVYQSVSMAWPNKKKAPDDYFIPLIHPKTKKPCPVPERGWRNPPSTMGELLKNNEIIFGIDETTQPRRKYVLKHNLNENVSSLFYFGGSDDDLLKKLKIPFDNPKPLPLVKEMISYFVDEGEIVLDYFAGSGSVAHATMALSNDDSKRRQFICIQVPEVIDEKKEAYKEGFRTISELCKTRIKRAIKEIKKGNGFVDLGFKVFILEKSNYKIWEDVSGVDIKKLMENIDLFETPLINNWKEKDLLIEILLIEGFPLDSSITQVKGILKNKILEVSYSSISYKLYLSFDNKVDNGAINNIKLNLNDVFICLDSAITDQVKMRLADNCKLKTI
ncbi:MAG: site-specific DNA-methyltransferase [Bacteroidota bacterium]